MTEPAHDIAKIIRLGNPGGDRVISPPRHP
jgi:hypothetical protein